MKKKTNIKKWIGITLAILGQSLIFVSSSFSNDAHLEQVAEYASDVVKEHTLGKKYCALTVEHTSESGPILYDQSEFYNLYGIFKQTKITFGSLVNLHDKFDIRFADIESKNNLSIFYVSITASTEYNDHYKNFLYPFELMFEGATSEQTKGKAGISYISVDQAKKYLIKEGNIPNADGEFSTNQYRSLIGRELPLKVDGSIINFFIANIYYQQNYYYEGVKEICGEFIISGAIPSPLNSDLMNVYFLSEYTYQNEYFMDYINKSYSNYKYLVKICEKNIVGNVDQTRLLSFYGYKCNNGANESIFIIMLTFSFLILMGALFVLLFARYSTSFQRLLVLIFFIPYLIFKFCYILFGNLLLFSGFACKMNFFITLIFIIVFLIRHYKKRIDRKGDLVNVFETQI